MLIRPNCNLIFYFSLFSVNLASAGWLLQMLSGHRVTVFQPHWLQVDVSAVQTALERRWLAYDLRLRMLADVLSLVTRTHHWYVTRRRTDAVFLFFFSWKRPDRSLRMTIWKGEKTCVFVLFAVGVLTSRPPFWGFCSCCWLCRRSCCVSIISNHPATTAAFRLAWEGFAIKGESSKSM